MNDLEFYTTLGRRFKQIREEHGFTYAELAVRTNSTVNSIVSVEAGGIVTIKKIARLCKTMGVSLDWIMDIEDDVAVATDTPTAVQMLEAKVDKLAEQMNKQMFDIMQLLLETCTTACTTQDLLMEHGILTEDEVVASEKEHREEVYKELGLDTLPLRKESDTDGNDDGQD